MAEDKIIKDFFDKIADDWANRAYDVKAKFLKFPSSKVRHAITLEEISKIKNNAKVLDMGCASGELVIDLIKNGYQVRGFDISPEMIKVAQENLVKENLNLPAEEIFKASSLRDYNDKEKFDFITAMGFTEYLDTEEEFFAQTDKLLEKDGYIIVDYRNKLFNFFTGNKYTLDLAKAENSTELLEQLKDLEKFSPKKYEEVPLIIKEVNNEINHLLQNFNFNENLKNENYKLIATQISLRQNTPANIAAEAEKYGYKLEKVIYFHAHPFMPMFEREFPVLFNTMALAMQPLGYTPMGASICSSFVAIIKKIK